jgi:site-specific recombinase XerD
MATVNFLYRSTKENSNLKLRFLFSDGAPKVIEVNSKIFISKTNWNKISKGKRLRDAELLQLKNHIDHSTNDLSQYVIHNFHQSFTGDINKKWLESQISLYYKEVHSENEQDSFENPKLLNVWIQNYIDFKQGEVRESTLRKQKSMRNNINRFLDSQTSPVYVSTIDLKFKKQFESFFDDENYAINTISRMLKFTKTVCKYAELNGNKLSTQFNSIKNRKEKTQSIYLTIEDQKDIEDLDLKDETLDIARDWLLIACSTGQRHSDFSRFNTSMIRDVKGKHIIEFVQKKVDKKIAVLLNDRVLKILEKYDDQFPPVLLEQKLNKYFKILGRRAKIDEMITGKIKMKTEKGLRSVEGTYPKYKFLATHTGRYSFASNNYGKVSTAYIKTVTGHTTEAALLEYIGKSDLDLALIAEFY